MRRGTPAEHQVSLGPRNLANKRFPTLK